MWKFKPFELRIGMMMASIKGTVESTVPLGEWKVTTWNTNKQTPKNSYLVSWLHADWLLRLSFGKASSPVAFLQDIWPSGIPQRKAVPFIPGSRRLHFFFSQQYVASFHLRITEGLLQRIKTYLQIMESMLPHFTDREAEQTYKM